MLIMNRDYAAPVDSDPSQGRCSPMAKATSKTIKLSDPDQTLLEACARAAELEAAIDLAYVVDPKDEVAIGELEQFQGLDCGRGHDSVRCEICGLASSRSPF